MEKIAVLGSTGSVGTQTLEVLRHFPDEFSVSLLAAGGRNTKILYQQIVDFMPAYVYVKDPASYQKLRLRSSHLGKQVHITNDASLLNQLLASSHVDTVIAAISGSAGLPGVWAALEGQKKLALANKEALVTAGDLIMDYARAHDVTIRPVDSEHSAIFQCLEHTKRSVDKIILTASGGPFRTLPARSFQHITVSDALRHPTWSMGEKITIDSASLANKGLEVIEASHLFDLDYDQIEVVVHPESIVHSLVEFVDGSLLAQMGTPDMKTAIQYALTSPYSLPNPFQRLDLSRVGALHFEAPRLQDFPMLPLAYAAGRAKKSAGLCYNTGNEVAVDLFRREIISFVDMANVVSFALDAFSGIKLESIQHIMDLDQEIRHHLYAQFERKQP